MRVVLGSSAVAGKRPFCDRQIAASGSRFRRAQPASSHRTLGSKQGKVISERWDFYGRLMLALAAEKMMLDRALTFGRYRLQPQGGLMSGAREIRLTPKALALLTFLAERPGKVISKEELFAAVWPGVAVGDAALVTCIQELRKALRDNARHPRYIETLHRRGYRFIAEITSAPPPEAAFAPAAPALSLPDRPSIAVLPFLNMSGDPEQDYFADGISEDLITGLARIRWLFVIARNSTFVYKNRSVDVKQVSRELGVRYVLEGSVRRAGNRLRISAQLIDATSGGHHWAERYDRELGDIFAVQDEITRSVAAALEPHLLAAEGVRALSRSAEDLGAWELVVRAQTHVWRMTSPDYATAIDMLQRAVETFPDYAPAQSLLAFCGAFAAHMGWVDRVQGHFDAITPVAPSRLMSMTPGRTSRSAIGRSWNAAPKRRSGAFAVRSSSIPIRRRLTRISATR